MARRTALLAVEVVGLLVLSVAACAAPPSGDDPAGGASGNDDRPTTPASPMDPAQALSDAAARVERLGAAYADQYAGVEAVADGLVVYRKPGGAFDEAVRAAVAGVKVSLRDAAHSRVELQALADRIVADMDYWKSQGVPLWTVGARHDGTGVEVGTPAGRKLLAGARKRYGDAPIVILPMDAPPTLTG